MNNILITGGSGFLGSELILQILSGSDCAVYALVRGKSIAAARKKLYDILGYIGNGGYQVSDLKKRVNIVLGDVERADLGLGKEDRNMLMDKVDTLFHCAALTDLNYPIDAIRRINVDGVRHILEFALSAKRRIKVYHISTAYVAGTYKGCFMEEFLDKNQNFNNNYERTKFEGEKIVREYRGKGLAIDVCRPSIILGRFKDGKVTKFKMLYQPLHVFSKGLVSAIPVDPGARQNLINVDTAARAIMLIAASGGGNNMTYNVVSPEPVEVSKVLDLASAYFGFPPIRFGADASCMSVVQKKMLQPYLPYFNGDLKFDMSNSSSVLTKSDFDFPEFDESNLNNIFSYCAKNGFIKKRI